MTLDATQRARLLTSGVRGCRVRLWLFDALPLIGAEGQPPAYLPYSQGIAGALSSSLRAMPLISPPYSLLLPGESVTLYGGDSFQRGGGPALGHTWELISGSAILQPMGDTCVVTPTVADVEVKVRLTTYAANGNDSYRYAYVAASVDGWTAPVGALDVGGSYADGGWSGKMTISGDANSAAGLEKDKLLLIHIETSYDGEPVTMGGYKRPENLALLRVLDWSYNENADNGRGETTVQLGHPDDWLERYDYWMSPGETDGNERGAAFVHTATSSGEYASASDFRITDAILAIVTHRGLNELTNFTVFDDSNEFGSTGYYWLRSANCREQIKSTIESAAGVFFCNFTGSIQCIPSPSVRADEWWGTPSPIFDAANPLTEDNCLSYTIHHIGQQYDRAVVHGFDDNLNDITVTAELPNIPEVLGDKRIMDVPGGFVKPQAEWAADMLAFANRDWDITVTLACPGNALNVGDFLYVDLEPRQAGHAAAQGLAYISEIRHQLDINRNMQTTTFVGSQLTAGSI